ncbi:hypothetical protein N3K63_02720 [Microbacterium sp. W1N]|uniref:endonuclease domain-containing protein n=1 Tax=Microbacterium festucae TaxID=2977531 RepID=UPI0021BE2C7F|nr:hypothetical protein [Microbacterium festucae]MCT9819195.1 hypothetical protein [Microbacterium festucae]
MRPRPLPPHLGDSFSVADARDAGVSAGRLRAGDLGSPFRGVRSRMPAAPHADLFGEQALRRRAEQYAHRMTPHEFFSHVTAAVLWDLPLPRWVVDGRSLDVAVLLPRRAPASEQVAGHALTPGSTAVVRHPVTGFAVTCPATTWALLGTTVRGVDDLVVAGDAAIRVPMHRTDQPALATRAQLEAAVAAGRRRGAASLRAALPLLHERSRSRPETKLRLLLEDAGLGGAEVNADVVEDGIWLGQVDLAYRARRVALEYEGEHHLTDLDQWHRDIARYDRLSAAGWRVIRVTKDQLARPDALLATLRRALAP